MSQSPSGLGSLLTHPNRAMENACLSSEQRRHRAVEFFARFLPLELQISWCMSSTFSYDPEAGNVVTPRERQ